jgi:hypothetical protein
MMKIRKPLHLQPYRSMVWFIYPSMTLTIGYFKHCYSLHFPLWPNLESKAHYLRLDYGKDPGWS